MTVHPLRPATRRRLGRPLPHQQTDRPRAHPTPEKPFHHTHQSAVLSGIRPSFPGLSRSAGQITHVLLTRSPLEYPASRAFPFDLHVLSTPPAFVLSQDQTLHKKISEQNSETGREKPETQQKNKPPQTTQQCSPCWRPKNYYKEKIVSPLNPTGSKKRKPQS